MRLKYYFRGLGIGMAVTALLLHLSVHASETGMTDAEVIERAKALGMIESVVLSENDPQLNGSNMAAEEEQLLEAGAPSGSDEMQEVDTQQDADHASDAGTSSEADGDHASDAGTSSEAAGDHASEAGTSSEADAAMEIGNTGAEDASATEPVDEEDPDIEHSEDVQEEIQQEGMAGAANGQEGVVITIVSGDSSVSVAAKLAAAGLVSSQAEYDAYLCANGYDRTIRTGAHIIPAGATNQQIAEIITTAVN